jgi:hypothetical protein
LWIAVQMATNGARSWDTFMEAHDALGLGCLLYGRLHGKELRK